MATRETERLGPQVKRYRVALGLTQEELAERAEVSARSISDLERGMERIPHLGTIRRLADALELSPEQRADFLAAGTQTRSAEDIPVPGMRTVRLPAPSGRAFLGMLPVIAVGAVVAMLLVHASNSPTTRRTVYSTQRAPVLLGTWGNTSGKSVPFGPAIAQLALSPNGYNYAIGYGPLISARQFSPSGQTLSTWPVAPASLGFDYAHADARGDLWVTTSQDVREFSPDGQMLVRWHRPGFNPGQFATPAGIAIAPNDDIVVGDYASHRVQVLTPRGKSLREWEGPRGEAQRFVPACIAIDRQSDVYILDSGSWEVDKYTLGGKLRAVWHPRGLHSTKGRVSGIDLSLDRNGHLYVTRSIGKSLHVAKLSPAGKELALWTSLGPRSHRMGFLTSIQFSAGRDGYASFTSGYLLKISENGHVLASWSPQQLRRPVFRSPAAIAADQEGHVYVADALTRRLTSLSSGPGASVRWTIPIPAASTASPAVGLAIAPHDHIVVVEAGKSSTLAYSAAGKLASSTTEPGASNSSHIGIDAFGDTSVLDFLGTTLRTFSPSGRVVHTWCMPCSSQTSSTPTAMTVSSAGNVYLAFPTVVIEFTPAGIPIRSWNGNTRSGRGRFTDATGLAIDRFGNIYVTEADRHALEIFSHSGRILANWTTASPKGPRFLHPGAVTVDPAGRIYLADGPRILELAPLKPQRAGS